MWDSKKGSRLSEGRKHPGGNFADSHLGVEAQQVFPPHYRNLAMQKSNGWNQEVKKKETRK